MNRKVFTLTLLAATLSIFSGCKDVWEKGFSSDGTLDSDSGSLGSVISEQETDYIYNTSNPSYIHCKSTSITLENCDTMVSVSGQSATIVSGGTYYIDGKLENGQIIVDAQADNALVQLVLDGVDLTCQNSAPLFIKNCQKAVLIIKDDTENVLTDYENSSEEEGVIYSKEDFAIFGDSKNTGTLTINAKNKDGIKAKDGLVIKSGNITVNSVDDGIIGKDFLVIHDAVISYKGMGDALKSTNSNGSGYGYVVIEDGNFNLECISEASNNDTAKNDAIKAETDINILGGVFTINTHRASSSALSKQYWAGPNSMISGGMTPGGMTPGGMTPGGGSPFGGGGMGEATSNKLAGMHGVTCGGNLTISGGSFDINAYGKGFKADGNVNYENATAVIVSERQGVGADGDFTIKSGKLDITSFWEGIEATNIYIAGGQTYIDAKDDGLNASNTNPSLNISDGFLFVKSSGDGIDSNGNIKVSGGVSVISQTGGGNSPIDCGDGAYTFTVSGGTVFAMGSSDMFSESIPSSTSNPMVYSQSLGNSSSSLAVENIIAIKNPQTYGAAIFISDQLTSGSKYSFIVGGTISGQEYQTGTGIYFPPSTVESGNEISVTATTQGGNSGQGGRFGGF